MKCILLAAGYATRLYPLTENFPKPLLPVGDRTILDWLADDLSPAVEEFIVVSNHRFAERFREWADRRKERISVVDDGTTSNETRLGAVRDIELAARDLEQGEDALVMAGDNILSFSLIPFAEYGLRMGTSCVMYHEEASVSALRRTAVISIDASGRITDYEEKPAEPRSNLAVPPFYYYRGEDIGRIHEALADGCGSDAPGSFAAWLSRHAVMHAWRMPGPRHDVGDLSSYEAVKNGWELICRRDGDGVTAEIS